MLQTSMRTPLPFNHVQILHAESSRILAQDFIARPGRLRDLFDFLVRNCEELVTPTEDVIAAEVFGKTDFHKVNDDASVRVYMHRLRKRLEDHYIQHPPRGDFKLTLPKGEYRLALIKREPAELPPIKSLKKNRNWMWAALGLLFINLVGATVWFASVVRTPAQKAHPIWADFQNAPQPIAIVVGNYYIFQPQPFANAPQHLIRDFAINSAQDLEEAKRQNPEIYAQAQNIDLHYLPVSSAYVIAKISPLLANSNAPIKVLESSEVSASTLKDYNIIYIGLLSGLGYLSRPVFEDSQFVIGGHFDQLINLESQKAYTSSEITELHENTDYIDYGYMRTFDGPAGNLISVIAGTRDTGLRGLIDLISDDNFLAENDRIFGPSGRYEILVEVRGEDKENLRQDLVSWKMD